ncbi:hypothetical protein DFH27DRAFT_575818 [Peziza echinospora]|nr:hypothetical protein DFH27DRAFT_575818 [Peziza echinospora]
MIASSGLYRSRYPYRSPPDVHLLIRCLQWPYHRDSVCSTIFAFGAVFPPSCGTRTITLQVVIQRADRYPSRLTSVRLQPAEPLTDSNSCPLFFPFLFFSSFAFPFPFPIIPFAHLEHPSIKIISLQLLLVTPSFLLFTFFFFLSNSN